MHFVAATVLPKAILNSCSINWLAGVCAGARIQLEHLAKGRNLISENVTRVSQHVLNSRVFPWTGASAVTPCSRAEIRRKSAFRKSSELTESKLYILPPANH
jgi:hypothetical protein